MTRGSLVAAGLLAMSLLIGVACNPEREARSGRREGNPNEGTAAAQVPVPNPEGENAPSAEPLLRTPVTLYFPSAAGDRLVGEAREILMTAFPGDRAKQILSDLISGPTDPSAIPSLPASARVLQVYVLADGVAYADFSAELRTGIEGGSATEILTVYSIVNSLALNVPEISRVGILVEGRPIDTLNGHLDLSRPLPPDRKLLESPEGAPRKDLNARERSGTPPERALREW